MEKYGLVLEGGGMRGAYTAGASAWLTDHHITFDYGAGISSGAFYLVCNVLGDTKTAEKMAVDYASDPSIVGLKALFTEGHYVAYEKVFREDLVKNLHFSTEGVRNSKTEIELGLYDLAAGEIVWFGNEAIADNVDLIRAACALPIASAVVTINGRKYLDGGVTKMIPIERSLEKGCTKHLVITTKPADYVRKPGSPAVKVLMALFYPKYPQLRRDYNIRHINYYKQIHLIEDLVNEGKALYIRPSKTIKVARFKGEPDTLKALYDLGYQDMEDRKEEILRFMGVSDDQTCSL
ncbi:MAG: patatin family protein [Solobacterium sp.]|nr:patatin family protein [Solobacterium sp.]